VTLTKQGVRSVALERSHTFFFSHFVLCRSSGVLKGLLLLPIILPAYVVGVLLINVAALPLWLDHGYATLY
jgi:hypothetical protein